MKLVALVAFLLGYLAGCAKIQVPHMVFSNKNRGVKDALEEEAFRHAKISIQKKLVGVPDVCQKEYNFDLPKPLTISLTEKEINEKYKELNPQFAGDFFVSGFYDHNRKTVYYALGEYDTLAHEYVHYFNWNPKINPELNSYRLVNGFCLDQISAEFIGEDFYRVLDKR